MKYKGWMVWLAVLLIAAGGWVAYRSSMPEKVAQTTVSRIKVQLKWLHQAQFAGHYVAAQQGYYQEEGIEVELLPFDFASSPIERVVAGEVEFGVTGADELLIARAKGAKIRALAVIYQYSPVVAYALSSSGIREPRDMVGKRLGMEPVINVESLMRAMIERQGVDFEREIKVVKIGFDVDPILNGEVDIGTGYETNEPIQVEATGREVNIIAPYKYGIKMYGDVLFATEEMIENNPELVQGFVRATLKGWEEALADPRVGVEMTLRYEDPNNEALNYEHQWKLLEKSRELIKPSKGMAVGSMNFVNWNRTYEILQYGGFIEGPLEISSSYTTQFLE